MSEHIKDMVPLRPKPMNEFREGELWHNNYENTIFRFHKIDGNRFHYRPEAGERGLLRESSADGHGSDLWQVTESELLMFKAAQEAEK